MKYISTKGKCPPVSASEAIALGAAPDGGLYVPENFPQFSIADFDNLNTLPELAERLFAPFLAGDPLMDDLVAIARESLDMDVPLIPVAPHLKVLELFHGPTGAFKDFGAQFLAACMARINKGKPKQTVLVATSGDTGGAVGAAFAHSETARAVILYPKGRISPFQKHQLTCWGDNVLSLEVEGDFDDCQRMVKAAMRDEGYREQFNLTSANSINIARLLPQISYYVWASLIIQRQTDKPAGFVIPTGNMGNAVACLWARSCGLPIGKVVMAINANRTLFDFFTTGKLTPRPSTPTLASAMDVGDPSNFERYSALDPLRAKNTEVYMVSDDEIRQRITEDYDNFGQIWCPHTAVAAEGWREMSQKDRQHDWTIVATAHPYKFREIVEPLINAPVPQPQAFEAIMQRESHFIRIKPTLNALIEQL